MNYIVNAHTLLRNLFPCAVCSCQGRRRAGLLKWLLCTCSGCIACYNYFDFVYPQLPTCFFAFYAGSIFCSCKLWTDKNRLSQKNPASDGVKFGHSLSLSLTLSLSAIILWLWWICFDKMQVEKKEHFFNPFVTSWGKNHSLCAITVWVWTFSNTKVEKKTGYIMLHVKAFYNM